MEADRLISEARAGSEKVAAQPLEDGRYRILQSCASCFPGAGCSGDLKAETGGGGVCSSRLQQKRSWQTTRILRRPRYYRATHSCQQNMPYISSDAWARPSAGLLFLQRFAPLTSLRKSKPVFGPRSITLIESKGDGYVESYQDQER
ncbi:MAG: hypothetical protein CVV42_16900 [Candidatus Riflebacteria bacterium HGW-Riflebacteria-2]|nr:MAG: hypothetical protein CVV42_16900 [Candidatus Riflebacteria bacterium HGW-Riflebacteria-2]